MMNVTKRTKWTLIAAVAVLLGFILGRFFFSSPGSKTQVGDTSDQAAAKIDNSRPQTNGQVTTVAAVEGKKAGVPPLTEAEKARVAEAANAVESRCKEIERGNMVTVFDEHTPEMSTLAVRIPEPAISQLTEINELATRLESTMADSPGAAAAFREKFQMLWQSYGPYRAGWPFKVIYLRTFDEGSSRIKVTSIVGYLRNEASTIPEATGRLEFPEGSHASSTTWDGKLPYGRWARERYGYLFEIDEKK